MGEEVIVEHGESLIAYWITGLPSPPNIPGVIRLTSIPIGFGVTAFSLEDAFGILEAEGHADRLPEDRTTLTVREACTVADIDSSVLPRIGPMPVRGIWYPFSRVGTQHRYGQ